MHSIEVVLLMLLAVLFSGFIVRLVPFSLPLPLIQIGLGAIIAGFFDYGVQLHPQIFFLFFLPPLLFLEGWRIPKVGLLRDKSIILQLALGLVIFTVIGAGLLIHWMIPAMPLAVAFALAAIVSPTDPVALSAVAAKAPIPKRLMHVLEGESLLNDASGLVCFRFAVAAAMTAGAFSLRSATLTFFWVAFVGVAVGVLFSYAANRAQIWFSRKFGEESGTSILFNLLLPFGAYLLAESLEASGILAAVAAGITMSYVELSGRALATTRLQRIAVWNTVQFTLNGMMFVVLGEQLPGILRNAALSVGESGHINPWWLLLYTLVINVTLMALRFVWVWASFRVNMWRLRRRGEAAQKPNVELLMVASLSGVRGAVTLAGVLSLPLMLPNQGGPFPARDLAIFLAAGVILISLFTASILLPPLLKRLVISDEPKIRRMEDEARLKAANAAITAVEQARVWHQQDAADADLFTNAATRVMALYQHRIEGSATENNGIDAETLRKADQVEAELRLIGMRAEREEIYRLARHGSISDDLSRKLVNEIDLEESRYF